jgi:Cu-Zn family superoxide dismutase
MNSWNKSLLLLALGSGFSLSAAPMVSAADITKAVAIITPTQGNKVAGKITFVKVSDGVQVEAEITGLTPGKHGFHIHEFGDLSAPDGASLGGHFNPHQKQHGAPDAKEHHAGDFGNLEADASGHAKTSFLSKDNKLDGNDTILGRGVVVHGKADDLKTQPSGDAGPRAGVGVIGVTK